MKHSPVAIGAMIVGLVLMLHGSLSEIPVPRSTVWTDKQAEEYEKASAELHNSSYGKSHDHSKEHSHNDADRSSPEYLKAKEAFDKSRAELDRAVSRKTWIKYGVILAGVLIAGYGIVVVGIEKIRADEEGTHRHKSKKH